MEAAIKNQRPDMRKPDGQTVFLSSVILGAAVLLGFLAATHQNGEAGNQVSKTSRLNLADIPFNGQRSYQYLKEICAIGPRVSGSVGMRRQQEMLTKHFTQLGGRVSMQTWEERHPQQNGASVTMGNMIVEWHPERKDRIVLCAHYDTRPFPDRDPQRPRGTFLGANDGASGVALLSELAHHMPKLTSKYGVDFVLFDAEEFVFDDRRDKYFLGSEHFAQTYASQPPPHRYHWGVLLDMIGDKELQLYQEKNSVRWRDTRPLVRDIWITARRLGVNEFIFKAKHEVRDDHLALRNIAKIPTCDIIDFDYPRPGRQSYWHTEADTPDKCSALSLAKVGWVIHQWLIHADTTLPPP